MTKSRERSHVNVSRQASFIRNKKIGVDSIMKYQMDVLEVIKITKRILNVTNVKLENI